MTFRNGFIIAIDGHSSCGKSTIARALAEKLHYTFIDTGAMYRAVTLFAMDNGWVSGHFVDEKKIEKAVEGIRMDFRYNEETRHNDLFLNDQNVEKGIRSPEVASLVSIVAAIRKVRSKLVEWQREMAIKGGIVMDGRDIGTVVFPNADLKLFVTADVDERARRRYLELKGKGETCSLEEVKRNLLDRDRIDSTREESPLKMAEDAILLDTTSMTMEQQLQKALQLVHDLVDQK